MPQTQRKVAIVTGASSGIGKLLAAELPAQQVVQTLINWELRIKNKKMGYARCDSHVFLNSRFSTKLRFFILNF